MGQDISKAFTQPPLTIQHLMANGKLDLSKYVLHHRRMEGINTEFDLTF